MLLAIILSCFLTFVAGMPSFWHSIGHAFGHSIFNCTIQHSRLRSGGGPSCVGRSRNRSSQRQGLPTRHCISASWQRLLPHPSQKEQGGLAQFPSAETVSYGHIKPFNRCPTRCDHFKTLSTTLAMHNFIQLPNSNSGMFRLKLRVIGLGPNGLGRKCGRGVQLELVDRAKSALGKGN